MKLFLDISSDSLKNTLGHLTSPHVMDALIRLAIVACVAWVAWLLLGKSGG